MVPQHRCFLSENQHAAAQHGCRAALVLARLSPDSRFRHRILRACLFASHRILTPEGWCSSFLSFRASVARLDCPSALHDCWLMLC